jgi:hypothetical protein
MEQPNTESRKKLEVLRNATFDWVKSLDDVWRIPEWDVPGLHQGALEDFKVELRHLKAQRGSSSPPGMVVSGPGGAGKTHLLSRFCQETLSQGGFFLMADMSAIREGLETVLKGMVKSLTTPLDAFGGRAQLGLLAERILSYVKFQVPRDFRSRYTRGNPARLHRDLDRLSGKLSETHPRESVEYLDILRTLLLLNSEDAFLRKAAFSWLKGLPASLEEAMAAGYTTGRGEAELALSGISFFTSLGGGFSVLALDQMDHIVSLFSLISHNGGNDLSPTVSTARAIITNLSDCLGRLTALTRRTLGVLSCLPLTWDKLLGHSQANTSLQRYRRPPLYLSPLGSMESCMELVAARMRPSFLKAGWDPPYPTWPFKPEAFRHVEGVNPRALMEMCHRTVRERLLKGDVSEADRIADAGPAPGPQAWLPGGPAPAAPPDPLDLLRDDPGAPGPGPDGGPLGGAAGAPGAPAPPTAAPPPDRRGAPALDHLGREFQEALDNADTGPAREESASEGFWPEALGLALSGLARSLKSGGRGRLSVQPFNGPPKGALELAFREGGGSGRRRILLSANLYQNPRAFQIRMEAFLERASRPEGRSRLVVVRFTPRPSGGKTSTLAWRFEEMGGLWRRPSEADVAVLEALVQLGRGNPRERLEQWMEGSRPWERLGFLEDDLAWLLE